MQKLWEQSDSQYRAQILAVLRTAMPAPRLLDVGCDDGSWTAQLARQIGAEACGVAGIEVVADRRAVALERGFDVRHGDLGERWPFGDDSFDIVHANQVIEHVTRLDHFVEETRRVLRPDGVAVMCTENLSSWHNVAAVVLGYMPFSLTNISRIGPVGNPYALHDGEASSQPESWQHTHVLTLDGLESIFKLHGFRIVDRFASGYYPAFGRAGQFLSRCDPRHAHFIGIVARAGSA